MSRQKHTTRTCVLIVGAGPAGLGISAALMRAGVVDQLVVDAREIGAAFRNWPRSMSLLTPSFYSNSFGLTDLNSIDPETSPADYLRTQHPDGPGYANYLSAVAKLHNLPVSTGIEILSVEKTSTGFLASTAHGTIESQFIVWAAGQFFYPKNREFPGSEHAIHSSQVGDWSSLEGDSFIIIGGYESGIDAALNLIKLGKSVRLLSRGEPWNSDHPDPSRSLSPRTLDRLREVLRSLEQANRLELIRNSNITHIEPGDGFWTLRDQDQVPLCSTTRPILANGFHSGLGKVEHLFDHDDNKLPIFSEEADESTLTQGLFYSGPSLVHRNALFCFIYKFRARFGVIAAEIAHRLVLPDIEEKLIPYIDSGFMNKDLDCCTNCECAINPEHDSPQPSQFKNK